MNLVEASVLSIWTICFKISTSCGPFMLSHTSFNITPGCFSMMIYSTPTMLSGSREFHAYIRGIGRWRISLSLKKSIYSFYQDKKRVLHTKFMVATSLAVVKWGRPALGFGSFAITSLPSSMVNRNTLVELALRNLQDSDARFWPNDIGGKTTKLWHVEFHVACSKLLSFPPKPSAWGESIWGHLDHALNL